MSTIIGRKEKRSILKPFIPKIINFTVFLPLIFSRPKKYLEPNSSVLYIKPLWPARDQPRWKPEVRLLWACNKLMSFHTLKLAINCFENKITSGYYLNQMFVLCIFHFYGNFSIISLISYFLLVLIVFISTFVRNNKIQKYTVKPSSKQLLINEILKKNT